MSPRPGAGAALRVLLDEPADAVWNMAVDEALLLQGGPPTLRCYGWQPHAVSLGYFQSAAAFADLPPGTPLVRRLTGGGAIHHGDELTFALAVDATLLPADVGASYALLHDAVLAGLRELGVPAQRLLAGAAPTPRPSERWCFGAGGRDDLVTARGKLLGSAQRRIRQPVARVLHHGSLVLQPPPLTPFAAAISDVRTVDDALRRQLTDDLVARLAAALDLEPLRGELTAAERALATTLQPEVQQRLRRREPPA